LRILSEDEPSESGQEGTYADVTVRSLREGELGDVLVRDERAQRQLTLHELGGGGGATLRTQQDCRYQQTSGQACWPSHFAVFRFQRRSLSITCSVHHLLPLLPSTHSCLPAYTSVTRQNAAVRRCAPHGRSLGTLCACEPRSATPPPHPSIVTSHTRNPARPTQHPARSTPFEYPGLPVRCESPWEGGVK
jgi:hypothetical protein